MGAFLLFLFFTAAAAAISANSLKAKKKKKLLTWLYIVIVISIALEFKVWSSRMVIQDLKASFFDYLCISIIQQQHFKDIFF